MYRPTKQELDEILRKHQLWLRGLSGGDRANLSGANLCGANLYRANLCGASLDGASLDGASLPSPTVVLSASWGELPDDLTSALMELDASGHPNREDFDRWASGDGPCPYSDVKIQRIANFQERRECWGKPHKKYTIYELMSEVLKLKCKGWQG